MTSKRDLENEMKRFGLDDVTADRLLSGQIAPQDAPPGYQLIADAVQKAAGSSPATDAAREAATIAVVVDALRSNRHPRQPVRRKSMLAQLLSAKIAAIAAATVLGATAAAAATNTLPGPAQRAISDAASHIGLSIPEPNSDANAQHGKPANAGTAVGPDAAGSAKYGLCTAYVAGPTTTNPHSRKNGSAAFANLQKAADAAGMSVAEYCKDASAPRHEGSTNTPGSGPGTSTRPAPNAHSATPPVTAPPATKPPVSTPPVSTPGSAHRP
jgi:hypothetical protein